MNLINYIICQICGNKITSDGKKYCISCSNELDKRCNDEFRRYKVNLRAKVVRLLILEKAPELKETNQ